MATPVRYKPKELQINKKLWALFLMTRKKTWISFSMIHVHPHQETLDPFRISHSESSKNYGCVRQGFVSLCWRLIKKKKIWFHLVHVWTLGKQILQILRKLVLLMELGFLNANRTAYTCNMFDKEKKVMLLLVLPCALIVNCSQEPYSVKQHRSHGKLLKKSNGYLLHTPNTQARAWSYDFTVKTPMRVSGIHISRLGAI